MAGGDLGCMGGRAGPVRAARCYCAGFVVVIQSKWTIIINCNKFHARIIYIQAHASVHCALCGAGGLDDWVDRGVEGVLDNLRHVQIV